MAKENLTNVNEVVEFDTVADIQEQIVMTGEPTGLLIEREQFKSTRDNKMYWGYFVRGKLRGKEIKAHLAPPDNGGYEVLELVFFDSKTAELHRIPYSMIDEKTGRKQSGFTYEARNFDEQDGTMYSCAIKPSKKSDKSLLDMLLSRKVA